MKVIALAILVACPFWILIALEIRYTIRHRRARRIEQSPGFEIDVTAKPTERREFWVD